MAFDFKKEYREFYMPKCRPEIVEIPVMRYLAVRGQGDPNEKDGAYQEAIRILYAVAYTLKMSSRTEHKIEGFFEYVVPPLEGFWWQEGCTEIDSSDKTSFCWISVLRLPDFVTEEDVQWAVKAAEGKKNLDCSKAEFLSVEEGLCVQIMHVGAFEREAASIEQMNRYLEEQGYEKDFSKRRLHHEIYLSDARRTDPSKRRTVIRHPIRKRG